MVKKMNNISELFVVSKNAVEDFYNDPKVKLAGIDVEIEFLKAHIANAHQRIGELLEQRREILDSIKK